MSRGGDEAKAYLDRLLRRLRWILIGAVALLAALLYLMIRYPVLHPRGCVSNPKDRSMTCYPGGGLPPSTFRP